MIRDHQAKVAVNTVSWEDLVDEAVTSISHGVDQSLTMNVDSINIATYDEKR